MPKGANSKLKILYILDYLQKNTNEDNPVSTKTLIKYLESNGISADRKTINDDIRQLNQYFSDEFEYRRGKDGGYYCAYRDFDLSEIKMLVDSVQSSKFITENQSLELIKKLEGLTNKYDAGRLHRQVVVQNRVKSNQEIVFNVIGHISEAINNDMTVRFRYMEYNMKKELIEKHDGKIYEISPVCLIWENENYYMIGYDYEKDNIKNFRVDKMQKVYQTDNRRLGHEKYDGIDISSYNKKVFNMFYGEETHITIRFSNNLIGVVIDKFGKDTIIIPENNDTFTVTVNVAVSKQFYAWLFGFPGECEVISPDFVREEMKNYAELTLKKYSEIV